MEHGLLQMSQHVDKYHSKLINKITEPLSNILNIPYFSYQKVAADGRYTVISNKPDFYEFYLENNFHHLDPYLIAPSNYRDGMITQVINNKIHELDPSIGEIYVKAAKSFNVCDSIIFIFKELDQYEIYVFAMPPATRQHLQFCLSQVDLLDRFIKHFKKSCQTILFDTDEMNVNIADIRGDNFNLYRPNYYLIDEDTRNSFLETVSPEEYMLRSQIKELSNRELESLHWMIQGKTAAETATILGISPRTVEAHRNRVRQKLGPHYSFSNLCYLIGKYALL